MLSGKECAAGEGRGGPAILADHKVDLAGTSPALASGVCADSGDGGDPVRWAGTTPPLPRRLRCHGNEETLPRCPPGPGSSREGGSWCGSEVVRTGILCPCDCCVHWPGTPGGRW